MNNWEWKKLGDVCDIYQPQTISAKELVENGKYLVYGANGVIGRYDKYNHNDSEILLTCRGATCGSINVSEPFSWINGNAMVVHPKNDSITKSYLKLTLALLDFSHIITGTAQPQITRTSLSPAIIPIPPLAEQNRIVKTLDDKFAKIDKLKIAAETNLKNAREIFNAELEKTFHGKDSWKTIRLGDCGTLKNGMNFTASDSGYTIHSLGVGDFKNLYQINDTKTLSKISLKAPPPEDYLLKDGDVVFVRSNGNKELVGRCVLVYPGKTPTTYSGFCIRFRKEFDELDSDFLLHFLKSDQSRKILNGKEGANISNLNQKILSNFEVPLPPLSVQKEIVARLDKLSENVKRLEANYKQIIANCDELKKSILKKTFEGDSRSSRE